MTLDGPLQTTIVRFTKFSMVGLAGVAVNSAGLAFFYRVAQFPLLVAAPLAVELAIISNFLLDNRWTFGYRRLSLSRFSKFNLAGLAGMALSTVTVWVLVREAHLYYLLANLVAVTLSSVLTFTVSTAWVWRRST